MKRCKRKNRGKSKVKYLLLVLVLIILVGLGAIYYFYKFADEEIKVKFFDSYLASNTSQVKVYVLKKEIVEDNKEEVYLEEINSLVRGTKVKSSDSTLKFEDKVYKMIMYKGKEYYVLDDGLVSKKEDVVLEKHAYIRSATSIFSDKDNYKVLSLASKGDEVQIIGYDELDKDGNVHFYFVKYKDIEGYVYGKYVNLSKEAALANYKADVYDAIHGRIKNYYGGGEAIKLDFYPNEKPSFNNNKMPDSVYALYLNAGSNTINNIDAYIDFAKETKINAFVVDIKDNQMPAYPAQVFKEFSPTNYEKAINSYDSYKNAISKLKEAGFYVIGRITVFKDSYYVTDNPEDAILNKSTNSPYLHNGSYWPSAYDRDVWYFNVALALEAVKEFGFNEINFDYVRFPDRMNSVSNIVELNNVYNEDKVEAIQRFVQYATDVLHEEEVYVSIDVFGETTNSTYTTAYGQYWPAISNVCDVISGMPYPDHFSAYSYGLAKPWNNPYQLMKYWGSYASDRQTEIPTPAKVRTWIQAYDVMKYVDRNGIQYNAPEVEAEIRGLYESSLMDGYVTWLSNSSLDKYRKQKAAFSIDYYNEYLG